MLSYLVGGLNPIASRFFLDAISLGGLGYASLTTRPRSTHVAVMAASTALVLATAGWTSRWTITLPTATTILPLAIVRRLPIVKGLGPKAQLVISVLSGAGLMVSAALCVLFPTLQLPALDGPFRVGVVDVFLDVAKIIDQDSCPTSLPELVSARILYPTFDPKGAGTPYIPSDIATEYCDQFMAVGAPPSIRKLGWMLHTWRLTMLPAIPRASLAPSDEPFPVVVYSHGLVGTAAIYSYQTMSLAARGYVVVAITHTDGSSPVVKLANDTLLLYDHELPKLWFGGEKKRYTRLRRERTNHRTQEMIGATEAFYRLNHVDQPELAVNGLPSFRGKLDTGRTTFMGHSFGGSTALTAAARRPDLAKYVVAHEPALDWTPDDALASLFAVSRTQGLNNSFSGSHGGIESEPTQFSVHDLDLLLLFSDEWKKSGEAWNHLLHEMHLAKRLGRKDGPSTLHYIEQAHHTEFSDTSMLMPLWLSRATRLTGTRNPIDTAKEIQAHTNDFLQAVHN